MILYYTYKPIFDFGNFLGFKRVLNFFATALNFEIRRICFQLSVCFEVHN